MPDTSPDPREAGSMPGDDGVRDSGADAAVPPLLAPPSRAHSESGRVLAGIVALLVLGVAAINVVTFRSASQRTERDGWRRLETSADLRRDGLANEMGAFRREALGTLEDADVRSGLLGLVRGASSLPEAARHEIGQARERFELSGVQLASPDGRIVWQVGESQEGARSTTRLVQRTIVAGHDVLGDPAGLRLVLAAPLVGESGRSEGVVLFHAADGLTARLLARWPGLGPSSRAYLVRQDGDQVVVLAGRDSTGAQGFSAGQRWPITAREAAVPAMAARSVESRAVTPGADGEPVWAVTRALSDPGWGLVALESRADAMSGLRAIYGLLLFLDLGLLIFVIGLAIVWRRLYHTGLARREAEITERDARRMQAVFDTAFDAILLFDDAGSLQSANRAAEHLFGRSKHDLIGFSLGDVLRWNGSTSTRWLPPEGAVASGEVLLPGGETVPVEFSVGHAGGPEDPLHSAIVRDMRERAEAERLVHEAAAGLESSNRRLEEVNAQLEEASRLKSEFLANTSHELRTPLNGMIGFLQLVLDGLCDSPDEERDYMRQALACSRHLLGLINDVLDIAKIEAGKLTLDIEKLDVQRVFDDVYTLTHVQAAQRGIELSFESDLDPALGVRGDFGKVKQVMVNLVGNSLKFTQRGRISVRARARESLGHVLFEVVDTGVGIPADRQKLIFEKFVQGDGSTTRRFGGTGLGLAISRSLVELMGGIIGVHSEGEGKGTRMYFSLPLWREDEFVVETGKRPTERIEGVPGGALVMVVEDDPVSRRLMAVVLQRSGYRTVEAENAESAWGLVRRLRPSCIVLDYALSCGDGATLRTGWDLAQRLTTERDTRHIPLVFVTGFDGELREKLRSTAFTRRPEHLVKPIDPRQLISRIGELVGEEREGIVRVLLADDDASVVAYLRKVLPPSRFHVEVAKNGEECLHLLRTQPTGFDVLLLDLMMPEVSGYDVLREMTLSAICPDLPVLVLTNFPEPRDESERQLLEQGLVIEIIPKMDVHANPRVLPAALHRHLGIVPAPAPAGEAGHEREAA